MDIKLKFPLKVILRNALTGEITPSQLHELYRLCYTFALHLIRPKVYSGKLRLEFIGLSEFDIAHDCIAEMFKSDDANELSEFCHYFEQQEVDINRETEGMLMVHVRRLTFSFVNDNLFRIYNEADPALGKIIRNIKIAVNNSADFKIEEIFNEQYLVLTTSDSLAHLSTISEEELENEVQSIIKTHDEIPSIIKKIVDYLSSQNLYQRKIRLASLALAIKRQFEKTGEYEVLKNVQPDTTLVLEDARTIIQTACRDISSGMKSRYVDKGKVDENIFDLYFKAIERFLCYEFLDGSDGEMTYFDCLKEFDPTMTKSEYKENHRTVFEYLAKLAKERVREKLKKM
jgi:hypothetical protein